MRVLNIIIFMIFAVVPVGVLLFFAMALQQVTNLQGG